MNTTKAPTLTPAAARLRTEIIARPGTLFTRTRPYTDLNPAAPLTVDPYGDAAHLVRALRDESDGPAHAGRTLERVVRSLPVHVLEDLDVTPDGLLAALKAVFPARPVYA